MNGFADDFEAGKLVLIGLGKTIDRVSVNGLNSAVSQLNAEAIIELNTSLNSIIEVSWN